ncbi:MAG: rhodanese-like domain-containing protein [Ferruginibacter sp.]
MQSIDAHTLKQKISSHEDILLIDVRETWEHEAFNIGGLLLPVTVIMENLHRVPKHKPVVIYCQKGIRSVIVIQRLEERFGYSNLINLTGGMDAWKKIF